MLCWYRPVFFLYYVGTDEISLVLSVLGLVSRENLVENWQKSWGLALRDGSRWLLHWDEYQPVGERERSREVWDGEPHSLRLFLVSTERESCRLFLSCVFRGRDRPPPLLVLVEQNLQYQVSGMAVLLTLAQVRWTQIWQELHSIIGRPP